MPSSSRSSPQREGWQAEEDRRYAAAAKERQSSEDKIMAGVPGWKSGDQGAVYNTTWLPPQHTYAPKMI